MVPPSSMKVVPSLPDNRIPDRTITVTLFSGIKTSKGHRVELPWGELIHKLSLAGGDVHIVGGATLDGRRRSEDHLWSSLLMMEWDGVSRLPVELLAPWQGVAHLAWTTKSHREGATHLRVVAPLELPLTTEYFPHFWDMVAERQVAAPDPSGRKPVQTQACPISPEKVVETDIDGPWLAVGMEAVAALASADAARSRPNRPKTTTTADATRRWGRMGEAARARARASADRALDQAVDELAATPSGERAATAFRVAARIGNWIGAYALDELDAERRLIDAARRARLGGREARGHIKSGIKRGKTTPRKISSTGVARIHSPSVDPLAEVAKLTVEEARSEIQRLCSQWIGKGGVFVLAADPGAGKSYAVRAALIEAARDGSLPGKVTVAVSTHDLAKEWEEGLDEIKDLVARVPVRDEDSCEQLTEYHKCVKAGIGRLFCHRPKSEPLEEKPRCPVLGECMKSGYLSPRDEAPDAQIRIITHARLALEIDDEQQPELLIVDEDPFNALVECHNVSADHVEQWSERGDVNMALPVEAVKALLARPQSPAQLAEAMAQGSISTSLGTDETSNTIEAAIKEADSKSEPLEYGPGAPRRLRWMAESTNTLRGVPSDSALRAVVAACDRGWSGCWVRDRELHIEAPPHTWASSATVIALDATATAETTRALWGSDAEYRRIALETPPEQIVTVMPVGSHPRQHIERPNNLARWAAAHALGRALTGTTLHVTHKKWASEAELIETREESLEDPPDPGQVAALLHRSRCGGDKVIHHGGTEARGVNSYEDCGAVVVDRWRVPGSALDARADTLAAMAGEDPLDPDVHGRWRAQARWQLEDSATLQVIHRIRPALQSSARITLLDDRPLPGVATEVESIEKTDQTLAQYALCIPPQGQRRPPVLVELVRTYARECGPIALAMRRGGEGKDAASRIVGSLASLVEEQSPSPDVPPILSAYPPAPQKPSEGIEEWAARVAGDWKWWRDQLVDLESALRRWTKETSTQGLTEQLRGEGYGVAQFRSNGGPSRVIVFRDSDHPRRSTLGYAAARQIEEWGMGAGGAVVNERKGDLQLRSEYHTSDAILMADAALAIHASTVEALDVGESPSKRWTTRAIAKEMAARSLRAFGTARRQLDEFALRAAPTGGADRLWPDFARYVDAFTVSRARDPSAPLPAPTTFGEMRARASGIGAILGCE